MSIRSSKNIPFYIFIIILALGLGGLVLHAAHYWPFLADDALISLRYSERLLQGKGLTWTEGVPVEGYSNFLWVLLNAGMGALGVNLVASLRLLGFAGMGAALAAILWASRPVQRCNLMPALAGSLAFLLAGPVAIWTIGGLEQPLLLALLAWGLVLLYPLLTRPDAGVKHMLLPGLFLALVCITRPDGPIFTASAVLALFVARGFKRRTFLLALGLGILPAFFYLAQLGFRRLYYGQWVPNTAFVKVSPSRAHIMDGLDYLWKGLISMAPLVLVAAFSTAAGMLNRQQRPRIVLLAGTAGAWMGYVVFIGGDIFPGWRHMLPLVLIFALLTVEGLLWLSSRISGCILRSAALAGLGFLLVVYGWLQFADPENRRAIGERWEWDGEVIGLMLKEGFDQNQPLLAVEPAGCLPYWSQLPSVDMLGLNDAYIAQNPPADFGQGWIGHELGNGAYVLSRQPDLVVFCLPQGSETACFRSGQEMDDDPLFLNQYTLVSFEGQTPYPVLSRIWVRRFGDRAGIRREGTGWFIPAYLLNGNPATVARLDEDGNFAIQVSSAQPALIRGFPLQAGGWRLEVDSNHPVQVAIRMAGGEGVYLEGISTPLEFSLPGEGEILLDLELTLASPGAASVSGMRLLPLQ